MDEKLSISTNYHNSQRELSILDPFNFKQSSASFQLFLVVIEIDGFEALMVC